MLDAADLQESRDLLLVPSHCGDGVPSGICPVSIGSGGDSQRRVLIDRSGGGANWKQANILVCGFPAYGVPGQDAAGA
jgi:hypothetical protein